MSRNWSKGSTTAWRKTRAGVLARDRGQCQLKLKGCTGRANVVHHTLGRGVSGDDPTHLVAACAHCNDSIGDPTTKADPPHRPTTRW